MRAVTPILALTIGLSVLPATGWPQLDAAAQPENLPVPPPDGVWRFDFGTKDSPVAENYYRVTPDTSYEAERGYGYMKGRARPEPFDQNRRVIRDVLVLDDVTRDGLYGGNPFRIDLPDGDYRVVVLTGQYSRPGANRPWSHGSKYSIKAGQTVLYEQSGTVEEFYHPQGRYFRNYYRIWHPDVDLYNANMAAWMPFADKQVSVTGGSLIVTASRYAPINALWVFPVDSTIGPAVVDAFREEQREFLNRQYPYIPGEPEFPMPELPEQARQSGVVLYVREDALALRPETRPVRRDLGRPLRLFVSQGEREAGVVAVTPLRSIRGTCRLAASDLTGDNGATIPASALDIRYIRYTEYPTTSGYVVRPHFLMPWQPSDLEEGITRGFRVDLHCPPDAAPGFYAGTLRLVAQGVEDELPMQVRVLPLKLPMALLRAGVYAGDLASTTFRHFRFANALPRELMHQVTRTRMQFYADQGFTGLFDSLPWYPFNYKDGKVEVTPTWDEWLELFRIAKSIPNFSDRVFCYYVGGPQVFPKAPHFLRREAIRKMKIDDILFSPEAVQEMVTMTKFLYERLREEKLPELVFYVQDELGNDGAKGARYGRELLKAINECRKAVRGGFHTCISTLRASIAREYLSEADIVIPNSAYPLNEETLEEIRANGCTVGLYNCGATRFSYGFYPWRVGAYLRAQWSFSYDGDSRDPFVALPAGSRVSCDCHFTPDWEVLPSMGMLVQREGVDDYRYIQLLEERLAAADKAGKLGTPATRSAQQVLNELRDAIKVTYKAPDNNWDNSTMNYFRWRVAQAAMELGEE